ncbi:TetR family transcriptional regulator [Parafrankia colletiae]|uniref:TetR family transcriptional regulator n=1 Tax=Parafrankia colletiae TaxID=573497 RepID=A0A1S1QGV0_9ACTN|nr:TetR/AcrR family transcriptional regulator [Parafrankia colletiae]MCK9901769.1 TetR/AcrR family transcriptional regulator [Frankia sp. Cpl3]OHV34008.1 TetR family transcriptional regulator [Parafrankia colletiae]
MTRPQPSTATATARQLMITAERLFAEHGLAGVSLRQIASEAGSANSSAVHYHFGSKEGLVEAIVAHRVADLAQRRTLLKARLDPDDLRQRLEAHLLPVIELAESPDSHYVSFLDQLNRGGRWRDVLPRQREVTQAQEEFLADMRRLLPEVEEPVRTMRIGQVQAFTLNAAAERERARAAGDEVMPFGLFVTTLVDGFAGYVRAPVSDGARRFLTLPQPPPQPLVHF